ncbi:MAG TPA: DUF1616 domain-containing protein [Syntrophaceticus sp.]|nr:DUF1616 domain-containing protein [Syntrophaceticus sp.]
MLSSTAIKFNIGLILKFLSFRVSLTEGKDFNVIRFERELHLVIILTLFLAGIVALGEGGWLQYIRVPLAVICLLYFPGYTVICAFFPGKDDLGRMERLLLSLAFSVIIVSLTGFLLNFTPWGVRLLPCLISISTFIIAMSLLAIYRRHKLPPQDQYAPFLELEIRSLPQLPVLDKIMVSVIVMGVLVATVSCLYCIAFSKPGERYTEFYILGENGLTDSYPRELEAGKEEKLIAGIVNHEQRKITYHMTVRMQNIVKSTEGPIILKHGEKWEETVKISTNYPHEKLKVEFLLFRDQESKPYRTLHLWVTVHKKTVGGGR